jgi:hypothetical protein
MTSSSAAAIQLGLRDAHWDVAQLWIAAAGIGGGFTYGDIERIASGEQAATAIQHDTIAAALNDHFTGLGRDHPVRYWRDL